MIGYDPATGQTKNFFKFQDYEGKIDIVSDGQGKFLEGPKQDEMVAQNEDGVNYFCFTRARATYPWDFMVFLFNYKGKYYYRLQEGGLFLSVYYGEAEINMIDDFSEPWKMKVPNKRLVIYHTGYQGDGADEALDDELHVIDMIQKDAVKNHIEIQEDPKGDKCVYTLVNGEKKKDLDGMTDVELWQECQKFFGIK